MRTGKILVASTAGAAVALVAALVLMLNWLGARHYARFDWTKSKIYTLSEKTSNVLKSVDQDVKIVVFMTPSTPLYPETKELLARYQAASPRISVETIDPDREPLRTKQLAEEFGVSAANTVVFVCGERKKYVTSDQLADYDYSGMQYGQGPKLKGFKGEEQFTSAIMGLVNQRIPKVYFVTGHGEHDVDGMGADGVSQLKEALARDNLTVAKTSLLSGAAPTDSDLLVVAGPSAPFAATEKAALVSYLEHGGCILVLLDPLLGGLQRPSGLEEFLNDHGVVVGNDLVIDPSRRLPFFDLSAVYVNEFRSHPVAEGLDGLAVLLPVARSVTTTTVAGVTSTQLLVTSADGWGETDLAGILARKSVGKDPTDTQGPVSLAVAAEPEKAEGAPDAASWRLVVVGDSDFATNGQIANAGNLNLALNAVNWLVKQESALGIAPRAPEQVQLFLSAAQMRTVLLISLVGLPLAAVAMGVAVWWRRRR